MVMVVILAVMVVKLKMLLPLATMRSAPQTSETLPSEKLQHSIMHQDRYQVFQF